MFDYRPTLVTNLNTILTTYPEKELYRGEEISTPCITYQETSDISYKEGDDMRYSRQTFTIKLWGESYSSLVNYVSLLDTKMKSLGFTRNSYNELPYGNDGICLIFLYEGLFKE